MGEIAYFAQRAQFGELGALLLGCFCCFWERWELFLDEFGENY